MSVDIRVLVVEDEPLIAQAHGTYVKRVQGFSLAGIAHGGQRPFGCSATSLSI